MMETLAIKLGCICNGLGGVRGGSVQLTCWMGVDTMKTGFDNAEN